MKLLKKFRDYIHPKKQISYDEQHNLLSQVEKVNIENLSEDLPYSFMNMKIINSNRFLDKIESAKELFVGRDPNVDFPMLLLTYEFESNIHGDELYPKLDKICKRVCAEYDFIEVKHNGGTVSKTRGYVVGLIVLTAKI
jgi:predicted nucleic acid-binding protein